MPNIRKMGRRGIAALEFALVLPLLVVLLLGVADIGLAILKAKKIEEATHLGAIYAQSYPGEAGRIQDLIRRNLEADAAGAIVNVRLACFCASVSMTTCSDSCATPPAARTAEISVDVPHHGMFLFRPAPLHLGGSALVGLPQ